MKSKEEIVQLAEEKYPAEIWGEEKSMTRRLAFENGYTQCQKDIRKDWQGYTISEKSDFIEFLNKQD